MKKCIKIEFVVKNPQDFLKKIIAKEVKNKLFEGLAQVLPESMVQICVCGEEDELDQLVDSLYAQVQEYKMADMLVEPFLKDKDYRGVFRILE
ncbi:hypothetical protein EBQ93_02820 [bacterium]|jgi:hypothetical protein|nr:hypothetical protein [bacterium]